MRALIVALGLLVAAPIVIYAHEVSSKGVTVVHPWARATPEGASIGSAFLEIKADQATTDRLTGVSSPVAERAEVHSHTMENGVMKMRRLDGIDLAPGQSHVLKPMSDHIMLFGLKKPLKEGDHIELTLTFEKAGPIAVEATVEAVGVMAPHGFDSQSGDSDKTPQAHDH